MAWQLKDRIGVQSVSLGKPSIPSFKKNAKKYVTNGLKLPNFIAYLNPNECLIMPSRIRIWNVLVRFCNIKGYSGCSK